MTSLNGDDKARYVSDMFDRISSKYDLLNTLMSFGMHHFWRKKATSIATNGFRNAEVLDIATGTGDFAIELASKPNVDKVVGLDFSINMLRIAKQKAQALPYSQYPELHWLHGDALALPFPSNTFSSVTVGFGIRNFADINYALSEMERILLPGGRLVILEITPLNSRFPMNKLIKLYMNKIIPIMGRFIARDIEGYTYLPESVEGFLNANELASAMKAVNFENVNFRKLGFGTVAIHHGEKVK
tara:strand:- start:975 stop:1706 length:732 start_codon:yes stop_codon:yes gene_type:complete